MWYLAKVSFFQQDEKGNSKKVTQQYLFDAVSYTDAETRVYQYCAEELQEFKVENISKKPFNEVFFVENNSEKWFKSKVSYIIFDEKSQKEKKMPFNFLLNANDIKDANTILVEKLGTVQDYFIESIISTQILDVIPYVIK
jgi:hypothetical protein